MYNVSNVQFQKETRFGGDISSCDVIMHKGNSAVLLGTDHLTSETAGIGGRVRQFLRRKFFFFGTSIWRNIFRNIYPSVRVFFTSMYILIERFWYQLEKWFR